eukprot:TRINITY_DN5544_c0_g1_i1.p1 TRINITY_DN5544_c0_g1~~TRINITY_DN5544_c0_g1_i1.p1  ORF type:complete len:110 (-),score=9.23 TRINITY_DN5544_c0_g1_i1:242-571(-)
MDSMIKSIENMVTPIPGNIVPKSSITYPLEPSSMEKSSVSMEDSAPKSKPSIKSEPSIEESKCHTKDPSVISCGVTLKILKIGPSMPEELVGSSAAESPMISAISTALN